MATSAAGFGRFGRAHRLAAHHTGGHVDRLATGQDRWGSRGQQSLLELVLGSRDPLALALLAFTAVVLAPLFEETIFRGALLPVLARRFGVLPGVLLSGLLFGMAHISVGELAPLTVLGIGLGVLRMSSGRLLPSVLMHGTWNAITFFNLLLL